MDGNISYSVEKYSKKIAKGFLYAVYIWTYYSIFVVKTDMIQVLDASYFGLYIETKYLSICLKFIMHIWIQLIYIFEVWKKILITLYDKGSPYTK